MFFNRFIYLFANFHFALFIIIYHLSLIGVFFGIFLGLSLFLKDEFLVFFALALLRFFYIRFLKKDSIRIFFHLLFVFLFLYFTTFRFFGFLGLFFVLVCKIIFLNLYFLAYFLILNISFVNIYRIFLMFIYHL
jgi:hypothetical protein